jgi:uncharacterized membrane protein (UPF0127 family)
MWAKVALKQYKIETASGIVLADHAVYAETIWTRALGLMFRKSLPAGQALILRPCSQIHMFFMRFPIDVAFVDNDGKVLHICNSIPPWRMSRIVFGAKGAVELPAGVLAAAGVTKGAVLKMS